MTVVVRLGVVGESRVPRTLPSITSVATMMTWIVRAGPVRWTYDILQSLSRSLGAGRRPARHPPRADPAVGPPDGSLRRRLHHPIPSRAGQRRGARVAGMRTSAGTDVAGPAPRWPPYPRRCGRRIAPWRLPGPFGLSRPGRR